MTLSPGSALPQRWVVSPLASAAWRAGQLEISAAGAEVKLTFDHIGALAVVHAFARPRTVEEVLVELAGWPSRQVVACVSELVEAGVLERDREPAPAGGEWDRHSLAFHRSSRAPGFRPAPPVAPAAAPPRSARRVALSEVDGAGTTRLAALLRARRSWRAWPVTEISFTVFSRLLWLCASNRRSSDEDQPARRVSRPYPSGGAIYSLELYPVLSPGAVESLAAGVYRYLPDDHGLEVISDDAADALPFLDAAARSAGATRPPVVIVVTSRFACQAAEYGTLAYSLVLKEVGGLFQTMYLVAADLHLAPCALGAGTPDRLLARLCGVSEYTEPVVGEFMIGPR